MIKKTTIINSNHLTGYYTIYLNLHKYGLCKYEIYKLIDNLITLFKTNTQNKENFINLLLKNSYKINFQKLNNNINFLNESKDDLYILKQVISKFSIRSDVNEKQLFEWLFLNLDSYIYH
jgi:hypothetical protein